LIDYLLEAPEATAACCIYITHAWPVAWRELREFDKLDVRTF
jgi:hypothetical protein